MVEETTVSTKEEYLKRQEEFVATRTTRFLLPTGLELVLRVVSRPVWTAMLVANGVTSLAMTAVDIKANKADNNKSLQMRVQQEMEANRVNILNSLIERTAVDVPEWFDASMMDEAEAEQLMSDYAIEMLRVGKGVDEAALEKFRAYDLLPELGDDEQSAPGDDAEPVSAPLSD